MGRALGGEEFEQGSRRDAVATLPRACFNCHRSEQEAGELARYEELNSQILLCPDCRAECAEDTSLVRHLIRKFDEVSCMGCSTYLGDGPEEYCDDCREQELANESCVHCGKPLDGGYYTQDGSGYYCSEICYEQIFCEIDTCRAAISDPAYCDETGDFCSAECYATGAKLIADDEDDSDDE